MKRMIGVCSLLALSMTTSVWACLWYYGTNMHGEKMEFEGLPPEIYVERLLDHSEHQRRKSLLPPAPAPNSDFKARSDFAATLVYQGETQKAIEILRAIEKEKPGEYVVAANLGTAYELHGDLAAARHWISEAIRRNPQSHYGTEWLHILILDARMALAKDPAWLVTHSVLGLDFGREPAPRVPALWPSGKGGRSVYSALEYQLHERMGFVPAPDPIVGDLLFDLGNVLATTMTVEHAVAVYDLAQNYKPSRENLLVKRRDYFQGAIDRHHQRDALEQLGWIGGGVVVVLVGWWVVKRRTARV